MKDVDKCVHHLNNLNGDFSYKILEAYKLLKCYPSGSNSDKETRGGIAEYVNKLLVTEFIKLNPHLEPRALYGAIFSKGGGYTTEIDNIIVTNIGVYILEVKSFYGNFIINQQGHFNWTDADRQFTPLAQNCSHCKTIYKLIKDYLPKQNPFFIKSIVPLFGDCSFTDYRDHKDQYLFPVCYAWNTFEHMDIPVKGRLNSRLIYNTLSNLNIDSPQVREQHISNVKRIRRTYGK